MTTSLILIAIFWWPWSHPTPTQQLTTAVIAAQHALETFSQAALATAAGVPIAVKQALVRTRDAWLALQGRFPPILDEHPPGRR
jgi:hypothetical protein